MGAVLREQNALPYKSRVSINSTAKDAIENGGAERATKGATITCDRGTEFANWREIESALNCQMYFADPYCAWQKGTNENLNGLLREFYPKGQNLSRVSPKTLEKNLALINARPKKILNFQKPQDLFELFLKKCCT